MPHDKTPWSKAPPPGLVAWQPPPPSSTPTHRKADHTNLLVLGGVILGFILLYTITLSLSGLGPVAPTPHVTVLDHRDSDLFLVRIDNPTNHDVSTGYMAFRLVDATGLATETDMERTYWTGNGLPIIVTIHPHEAASGWVAYTLPDNAKPPFTLTYDSSLGHYEYQVPSRDALVPSLPRVGDWIRGDLVDVRLASFADATGWNGVHYQNMTLDVEFHNGTVPVLVSYWGGVNSADVPFRDGGYLSFPISDWSTGAPSTVTVYVRTDPTAANSPNPTIYSWGLDAS